MGNSMASILKPETVESAELYVGTTLKKWWDATATSREGWYKCRVKAAHDHVVNGLSGEVEEGLQLTLRWAPHAIAKVLSAIGNL